MLKSHLQLVKCWLLFFFPQNYNSKLSKYPFHYPVLFFVTATSKVSCFIFTYLECAWMLCCLFWFWPDVEKRKNLVCGFSTPLEGSEAEAHRKPEVRNLSRFWCVRRMSSLQAVLNVVSTLCGQAIILEGSYWKRRIEVVIKEYHKWRIYYKKRVRLDLKVWHP